MNSESEVVMMAITNRLLHLEDKHAPLVDQEQRIVELIREQRRRRLEAEGKPFEELPRVSALDAPGRCLSVSEIIRIAHKQHLGQTV